MNKKDENEDLNILQEKKELDKTINSKNEKDFKFIMDPNAHISYFYPVLSGGLAVAYNVHMEYSIKKNPNKYFLFVSSLFVFSFAYGFTRVITNNFRNLE
jgi:hypothetical protein